MKQQVVLPPEMVDSAFKIHYTIATTVMAELVQAISLLDYGTSVKFSCMLRSVDPVVPTLEVDVQLESITAQFKESDDDESC